MTYLSTNTVYNMDCFDFLENVENLSIDLAIIDPPYNMKKADWDTFKSQDDFLKFTYKWIDALIPKLKENASLYIFNTPFNCAFILQYLLRKNMVFQNWVTWDKRDGLGTSKRKYANGQETVLFFTKSDKHTFNYNDIRLPYESTDRIAAAAKKGIIKNGKRWFPNPDGRLCGEVWHIVSERHKNKINGRTQKQAHLTPKPLELIERIIKASSNKGDLVLDCFVGSGTTAIAAKKLGRNFIVSDKDEKFAKLTDKNIKDIK
jgi:site-specific DNA-methyltransferase (adenine-specific)